MQPSLAPHAHQKLAYRFFEPFRMLAYVSFVAYKLRPNHSSIHLVFYVSQLKRVAGAENQVITPVLPSDFAMKPSLEQVLQTQTMACGPRRVQQILIKWINLPHSFATWKILKYCIGSFPVPVLGSK